MKFSKSRSIVIDRAMRTGGQLARTQAGMHRVEKRWGMLLLNPAFMYAATWTFVLVLYSLGLSDLLEPLQTLTVVLVVGSSLAFISGWALESLLCNWRLAFPQFDLVALRAIICSAGVGRRLKMVWFFLGLGITLEIVYFRGAPALGLIGIGPEILYTDFGITGLHGLLNSMFYACSAVQFTRIMLDSSKGALLLILVSLCYPMLVMSRQVLISLLLQYMFIYFSIRRPSLQVFFRASFLFSATLLIFGYLGDVRSGRENIIALAAPTFAYPDWLPSAFIWVYIYLSTPLNNVNFNIDITPNFLPFETMGTLIPSFARDAFMSEVGATKHWELVTDSFNVSSLLQSLLTDFGVSGTIVFTLLCGVVFTRLMRRATTSPAAFFAVIVLLHGITLSFFANLLFHLVFMFEILIIAWVVARGRRL
jgi:oligosaccharide repeat unit polymerase